MVIAQPHKWMEQKQVTLTFSDMSSVIPTINPSVSTITHRIIQQLVVKSSNSCQTECRLAFQFGVRYNNGRNCINDERKLLKFG